MNIRHVRYFVALAREGHYGRAAAACNVTQPTLSEAIRQIERTLAVPLVDRDRQRYRGLTQEGERALVWMQRILADQDALHQELAEMREGLSGDLRFGVIPAAMPIVPFVTRDFCRRYPGVTMKIVSLTSIDIQQGLDARELEAGLTYLENEPLRNVQSHLLYSERYLLLTPRSGPLGAVRSATWRDAARLPLCLLTPDMQNRRIVNRLFVDGGAGEPRATIETNSVLALVAYVRSGEWSSVVPHTFLTLLGHEQAPLDGLHAVPLVSPKATQAVGIVVNSHDPLPPLPRSFLKATQSVDISAELARSFPKVGAF